MDFFDSLGDFFNSVTGFVERVVRKFFGSSNDRAIRQIGFVRDRDGSSKTIPGSVLDRITQLEPEMNKLTDAELRSVTDKLKQKLVDGSTLDQVLPEAFA